MSKPNDGGTAFPCVVGLEGRGNTVLLPGMNGMEWATLAQGMSLRAWLAAHETLSEWDDAEVSMSKAMAEALAGEKLPEGAWSTDPLGALRFEAKWRAALKLMRADAMIAELDKDKP